MTTEGPLPPGGGQSQGVSALFPQRAEIPTAETGGLREKAARFRELAEWLQGPIAEAKSRGAPGETVRALRRVEHRGFKVARLFERLADELDALAEDFAQADEWAEGLADDR